MKINTETRRHRAEKRIADIGAVEAIREASTLIAFAFFSLRLCVSVFICDCGAERARGV